MAIAHSGNAKKLERNAVRYLAHVRQDGEAFIPHDLGEHLRGVGKRAEVYAQDFKSGDWAKVAGLWHDLGKYSVEFQRRIKSVSGYDPDAHLEGPVGRVDHSTAGAQHAVEQFGVYGRILAYIIAGHHAGLPDWHTSETGGAALNAFRGRVLEVRCGRGLEKGMARRLQPSILGYCDIFQRAGERRCLATRQCINGRR